MKIKRLRRLPVIAGVVFVAIIVLVGWRYISNEYQTYHKPEARAYETVSSENAPYELRTARKELLGSVYASFSVYDSATQSLVYQCPDLYLVKELESIGWVEGSHDICVEFTQKDPIYYRYDDQWRR